MFVFHIYENVTVIHHKADITVKVSAASEEIAKNKLVVKHNLAGVCLEMKKKGK